MFRGVWEKSLQKLASWIDGNREAKFEEFFNTFRDIFSEEYDEVLRSKEFVEAQNKIRDALTDLTDSAENMMEAQMEMFPVMPFAPRKEVDEIEKRVYNHKKISNALERRIADIEKKFDKIPDELNVLRKKMEKIEVKGEKNE
jgi:DNA repair ATPase RecN